MTPRPSFDDDLNRWLRDGPTQAPTTLLAAIGREVSSTRQRPGRDWRASWQRPAGLFAQAAAAVVVVAAIGLGAAYLADGSRRGVGGPSAPAGSAPAVVAATTPGSTAGATARPSTTSAPAPTAPAPTAPPPSVQRACGPATVEARITAWQGAAGQRIAEVELTNTSSAPCTLRALARPQLVDGTGAVLIDSPTASPSALLTLKPGGRLTTLVEDGNYCGPAPAAPVRIALTLSTGERVIASAPTPGDATVPPCNGTAVGAYIRMHSWGG